MSFPKKKLIYKSASILPYYFNGQEYLYLFTHEKDGDWCGAFGGGMEKSDRNNPWINACRELGEELYDYKDKNLKNFINRIKVRAKSKSIQFPYPRQKHYDYICNWRKISPKTTPIAIKIKFRPNIEIKDIHWVKANDLWKAINKTKNRPIFGKRATPVYVETISLPNFPSKKIRIRPCFVDSYRQIYKKKLHTPHLTNPRKPMQTYIKPI